MQQAFSLVSKKVGLYVNLFCREKSHYLGAHTKTKQQTKTTNKQSYEVEHVFSFAMMRLNTLNFVDRILTRDHDTIKFCKRFLKSPNFSKNTIKKRTQHLIYFE